ncbi:MAG TPA: baseplate J/gp47 family protein [Chitinophagaceae bacterium]|nr:baseplate J/gp47 family protein [Chitinophagaceae bacterium]
MAKKLYDIRNYPRSGGTSQPGRHNASLMGEKVSIIEQDIADYIVFAQKLSAYLIYYNERDQPAGNWQNFLVNDVSYHLAVIAADKPGSWEDAWHELTENVETNTEKENKKYFTWRFDFLYTLIGRLTDAFSYSKQLSQWENDLKALYTTANLDIIYDLLKKYSKASEDLLSADAGIFSFKDMTLNKLTSIIASIETNNEALSNILSTGSTLADDGKFIFGDSTDVIDKINAATEYLDDLAQQLLRIYARVHDNAEAHLRFSLTNYDEHQPHVGLFYAFLQLLQEHKTDINSLLLKHLDYYYRQVLYVKSKPYLPSKTYVTFEPAKNVKEYFIKTGSQLAAGKDVKGKDIFYKTQQDIVVNKAVIGEIRSFTVIKNKDEQQNERTKTGEPLGIFACPQANSSDGNGKPLQPGESWDAFRTTIGETITDAQIGISFYADLLLEAPPSENKFQITAKFKNPTGFIDLKSFVENYCIVEIFTEKEPLVFSPANVIYSSNQLSLEFTIPEKTKIKKSSPNVSILFGRKDQRIINDIFFTNIKALQTSEIDTLSIKLMNQTIPVGKVETVLGMTDLSASFPAFGGVPKTGSWFKIIEPILNKKSVSGLKVKIEWASKTEAPFNVVINFSGKSTTGNISAGVMTTLLTIQNDSEQLTFHPGEVQVILNSDLGHSNYGSEMAKVIMEVQSGKIPRSINEKIAELKTQIEEIKYAVEDENGRNAGKYDRKVRFYDSFRDIYRKLDEVDDFTLPPTPYTPVIKSINLTCTIEESILSNDLFSQYPHGYKEIGVQKFLLPPTPCEGELFIGFKGLAQAQSLNVLVQVEEGSADPTLPNPEVSWTFLHNNTWQNFDSSQFKDGTKGLIQSGIVSFVSPGYDCTTNTLLQAGQFWIRAAIKFNQTKAVCKIFSINTQAVLAQFVDNGNDAASLGSNLPANTITQLFPKQASIKKVEQPFASFGGRLEEENSKIYIRTSERLRHKSRAVTAWDYEHIIAESFPEIYKVKVLNHAYMKIKGDEKLIVSKPGELIILVIGKTAAQSSSFKPLVSKSKLTEITEFITQLNSSFAKINVMNPLFEEVTVDTIVTFRAGIVDEAFYKKKLQTDIKRFLSPWAFEDGAEPDLGGVIYRAALLDFIEELDYIDFVEKLEITHQNSITGDVAASSSPASILISAQSHKVDGKLKTVSKNNSSLITESISAS